MIHLFHCALLHIFSPSTQESDEYLRPKCALSPASNQCASLLSERQPDPSSPFMVTPLLIPCQPLLLTAFQLTQFHGQHESFMDQWQTLKNNITNVQVWWGRAEATSPSHCHFLLWQLAVVQISITPEHLEWSRYEFSGSCGSLPLVRAYDSNSLSFIRWWVRLG